VEYPDLQEEEFEGHATIKQGGVNYYMEFNGNLVLVHRVSSVIRSK
jgi:hypothetical protein